MSFAKARRFLDVPSDAPSPTRYDPKLSEKSKGGVIGCKERERERTSSFASDTLSTGGTPFRTPFSVVKKHSCVASTEKLPIVRGPLFSDGSNNCDADDGLLRSDHCNKSQTIHELEKLVNDLTVKLHEVDARREQLESQVATLEVEKSHLECSLSNASNNEKQINELTLKVHELQCELGELKDTNSELLAKKHEAEERIAKLEEGNLEYERRILSLEGTLEQIEMEREAKRREHQDTCDKLKTSIDHLQDSIATMEMDNSRLEACKSNNEETIFALETKVSSLNNALETSHKRAAEEIREKIRMITMQEDMIKALDMQLEAKSAEVKKALEEASAKISKLKEERSEIEAVLAEVRLNEKQRYDEICQQLQSTKNELDRLNNENSELSKLHREELFKMQDECEKKVLEKMQESEQALLEKEAVLKLADLEYTKIVKQERDECERKIREMEMESSLRQSQLLEAAERAKEKYLARIADLEVNIAEVLARKAQEAAAQTQRYDEVISELTSLTTELHNKKKELATLSAEKDEIANILDALLIESKQLSKELEDRDEKLVEAGLTFTEERKKNERLSEHLGELDSKILVIENELQTKQSEIEKLSHELITCKDQNNTLKMKNIDLQLDNVAAKDKVKSLEVELERARVAFNAQLVELREELSTVRSQERKFEIAITDTRKSLDALVKRLMESESDVERLIVENDSLKVQLSSAESANQTAETKCQELMDTNIDLKQKLNQAEAMEEKLRKSVTELERKNCDLELTKNDLIILRDTLENDKENYESSLRTLTSVVNEQKLKMVQFERTSLDQVEAVSQALLSKLEAFQIFSSEQITKLKNDISMLSKEKNDIEEAFRSKSEQFDLLFTDHDILKTAIDISNKECDSLKRHYEEQRIVLEKTMIQMAELEKSSSEIAKSLDAANAEKTKVFQLLEESKKTVDDLLAAKDDLNHTISKLENQVTERNTALNTMSEELILTNADLAKLKDDLVKKESKIEELQKEKKQHQQKLMESTDKVVTLLLDLEAERESLARLEKSNKSLNLELEKACELRDESQCHLRTLQCKYDSLSEELSNLKDKYVKEKEELLSKIESDQENSRWKNQWEKLMEEKDEMAKELLAMSEKKDYYKNQCRRIEEKLTEAIEDRETAVNDFDQIHKLMQEKDDVTNTLKKRIQDLESLIGPFREQLEQYEAERMMLVDDREELRRQYLEQAAKLGHQNHKQKIQHVVKLKADILELRKENKRLQANLKMKDKTVESLREELGTHPKRLFIGGKRPTSTPFKGKENDGRISPIDSLHQESVISSSPLRNRNQ